MIARNFWTFALGAAVLVAAAWAARAGFVEVSLDSGQLADLGAHLASLIFAALVIERAVEVIVSNRYAGEEEPLRRDQRAAEGKLAVRRAALQAAPAADPLRSAAAQAVGDAEDRLAAARSDADRALGEVKTRKARTAALLAVGLGAGAAVVGLRILGPFIQQADGELIAQLAGADHAVQLGLFRFFDTVLTAVVLAGGADGIHKIINAFRRP